MPTECARAGRAVNACKATVGQGPPTKRRPAGVIKNPCSIQAGRLAVCKEGSRPRLPGGKGKRGGAPGSKPAGRIAREAARARAPGRPAPAPARPARPAPASGADPARDKKMMADYGGHSIKDLNAHLESIKPGLSRGGNNGGKIVKLNKIRMNRGLSTLAKKPPKKA